MEEDDSFDKMYKGEISKSGAAILPSKRVRRMPEKISVKPPVQNEDSNEETEKKEEQSDLINKD